MGSLNQATAPTRSFPAAGHLDGPQQGGVSAIAAGVSVASRPFLPPLGNAERKLLSLVAPRENPAEETDWTEVAALAERLWLEPRLARHHAEDPHVPNRVRERWLAARRSTAARNLLLHAEETNLLQRLRWAGVESIPLKGTSLAGILGDPAGRTVSDIDLGVRAADVAAAAQVLRETGYSVKLPDALLCHRSFLLSTDEFTSEVKCVRASAASPILVELHWKWLPLAERDVWSELQVYEPAGVRTLAPEHYFLFLCWHAAGGGWCGLRWLCDIQEFLQVLGQRMDAARCVRLAGAAGLARAVGITLALLEALLDFRFPQLHSLCDARVQHLAQRYYPCPFQPFLTGSVSGIHRDRLRILDSPGRRLGYGVRLLRPTFQEWLDEAGAVRPAIAAWALRVARLGKMGFAMLRAAPSAQRSS